MSEKEIDRSEYEDHHDAYPPIGGFLENVYLLKRTHSSLLDLTLAEFEGQGYPAPAVIAEVV